MNLNSLTPQIGSVKSSKRIGRGVGSGKGRTAARGHKGAKSRSGYSRKSGFEGGQMPLQRRIPKFGFNNFNRVEYKAINLDVIESLALKGILTIDLNTLVDNGITSKNDLIKLLGRGELKSKVTISVHAFSSTAKEAVEKAGGQINVI